MTGNAPHTRGGFKPEAALFVAGWWFHLIARDLVPARATANAFHGLGVACFGAAAAMSWQLRHGWLAALTGTLALVFAIEGPPAGGPRSLAHRVVVWALLAISWLALYFKFKYNSNRPASELPGAPLPTR